MSRADLAYFDVANRSIAYRLRRGASPALVFLPGYASDMEGAKALALDRFAEKRKLAMLRLDYSGTGSSHGRLADGRLDWWLEEALAAVDRLTKGKLILVGSSMGAWIALHLAQFRPARVKAVVGIAVAPDFTSWGFDKEQVAKLTDRTHVTRGFWESGQKLLLLNKKITVDGPVRLVHGDNDKEVPVEIAQRTIRAVRSADVQLKIVKGGGHRLSEPHEIDAILRTVAELLEPKI